MNTWRVKTFLALAAPRLTRVFVTGFYGMGAVKLLLGALMLTVFYPNCPDGCTCVSRPFYAYPVAVLVIACFWIHNGYALQAAANEGGAAAAQEMTENVNDDRGAYA